VKKENVVKGAIFFVCFLIIYWLINFISIYRTKYHFGFSFEETLPLMPVFVFIYISVYLFVALPFFVLEKDIKKLLLVYSSISISSFVIKLTNQIV
jgi:hypothetical protein